MKRRYKILLFFVLNIVFMLLIPFLLIRFSPADVSMTACMVLFFAVYPILFILLGIVIGKDMKHLWWMPIVAAFVFPLLFSVAMGVIIFELYTYSGIYIFLGYAVSALLLLIKKIKLERESE